MCKARLVACVAIVVCGGSGVIAYGNVSSSTQPADAANVAEAYRLVDQPGERISVLRNGLTVILKAHRTAPVVSVRMYCKTGSIYEQEYLGSGVSHLFEHLLHGSATTTRSEADSRTLLDEIGGNTNAFTSMDLTCYFINTDPGRMGSAIHLLGDWISRPTFPQEAFDREWGVVQRELERDVDDPDRQFYYLTMETMYQVHPARYPIIGHKPIVQQLTKEDIVGYYHRMYVPDNIVVAIAGDMDLDAALAEVQAAFSDFQRKRVPNIVLPEEPIMATPRSASRAMDVPSATLRLAWQSISLTDPDLYALDLVSHVLTEGENARLQRAIRDAGITFNISSYSWTPQWGRGMFAITARLNPAKLDEARSAILAEVARMRDEPVSAEELATAKRQKAAEHVFAAQTAEDIAEMMARDYMSTGDADFSRAYVERIQAVTAEQVQAAARKYLDPQIFATITLLPKGFAQSTGAETSAGEPDAVRRVVLPNGLRCLIRRDPTSPLVAMQAFMLGGVLFEDASTNGLSRLAATLGPRGTAGRTAEEIAGVFDGRGGSLAGASGRNTIYLAAQVLKDDFAEAFPVFAEVVCRPSFPQKELDLARPRQLDQIARLNETWRGELMAYFDARMYPEGPYGRPAVGSADVVGRVTREELEAFYQGLLTGPNMVVAVYGDIDPAEAERMVREGFGGLPNKKVPLHDGTGSQSIEKPALYLKAKPATRAAAGIALGFPGPRLTDLEDMAQLAVLDTIISGYRYPTGWLHESLRGGSNDFVYEIHAINQAGLLPGAFQVYAACQPQRVNEVYRIISAELDKARAGKFSDEELERARNIIVTTEQLDNQTNADRAMQASLDELYGLGHDYRDRFVERIKQVTLDEVRAMAAKFLTVPVVTVVTPAPDELDLGIAPTAVEQDAASAALTN